MGFVLVQPALEALDVLLGLGPRRFEPAQLRFALGDSVLERLPTPFLRFGQDGLSLLLGAGEDA